MTLQALAGLFILLALMALAIAATIEPDPAREKRRKVAEAEKRKAERKQWEETERERQTADLKARGLHITTRIWEPSVNLEAPAKPEVKPAANVRQIRGKR